QALQQWEEARRLLEEAVAVAERFRIRLYYVPILTRLCLHYAVPGQWDVAYKYAVKTISLRRSFGRILIAQDFFPQYETEALLRMGNEQEAREAVHRLGASLGSNRRYRVPYLQALAILDVRAGENERAIGHLREAAQLAAEIGLPAEQWQIQASLGKVYE